MHSTIGMLGGGQLGRMAAMAASSLGYRTHVFTTKAKAPSTQVTDLVTIGAWEDRAALTSFASQCDVITFEFENIPIDAVRHLDSLCPVHPGARALKICQDRALEKSMLQNIGVVTTAWKEVSSLEELEAAALEIGFPAVLKTATLGYDGHGQVKITHEKGLAQAWKNVGEKRSVLEAFVDFERELSIVAARAKGGQVAFYPLVENKHTDDHILTRTLAPAPATTPARAARAVKIAKRIAESLDYIGVFAVEFFQTHHGTLLVNEIAPRPHNSGHWTMDGAITSQFEQQIRAVAGLPLGDTSPTFKTTMVNLLGEEILERDAMLALPNRRVHIYGKTGLRPGRKMGHVNILEPLS
jgi:5-(carboxyamino)imidazole ribonucleotide synthase